MDIPGNNDLPFDEDPDGFRALQPNLGSLGEQRAAPVAPPTPIPPQSEPPPPAAALPVGYERPIPAEEQDYADKRGWKTIDGLPWGTRKIAAAPAVASTFVPPPAPGIAAIQPGAPTGRQIITHQPIVSPAEAQAAGAVDQANAAERANAEKAGQAGVDHASQEAQQADREAAEKQRQLDAADALRKQYARTISEKKAEDDAAYQRYRSMGLKDPDADASFGHRVAAAIALGLGAYSAAINHTSNGAAQVFEQARKDNLELQKAAIERAREDAVRAGKSVDEARAEANQALHDLQVKGVAQIDAMRSTFAAESKRLGVNDAQIAGSKMMTDLDKSAAEAREKHLDSLRVISRDLTPKELKEKAPGGGGGGVNAEALIRKMVSEGRTGEEIAKATPAVNGKERARIMASEEGLARERKGEATGVSKEMQEALKPVTAKGGIRESQEHLQSAMNKLRANGNDPTEWTNAIDAAIRSNTGRAAIIQQYKLYVQKSGGAGATFDNWLQQAKDGNLGDETKRNLLGSFNSALSEYQRLGAEHERNFRENFGNDPRIANNPTARAAFEAAHKSTFGTMAGGEGISRAPTARAAAGSARASSGGGELGQAQAWLAANPGDRRAPAVRARIAAMIQGQRGQ